MNLNNYKKTNVISKADAAYLAGLIDGEGTITLVRKHRNEHRQLGVFISSTERHLLEFAKAVTGVGKITTKKTSKSNHSPGFAYAVYNRQALDLLNSLFPYLRSYKRDRAKLILKHYLEFTPRNGKYTEDLLVKKGKFEKAVLDTKANG